MRYNLSFINRLPGGDLGERSDAQVDEVLLQSFYSHLWAFASAPNFTHAVIDYADHRVILSALGSPAAESDDNAENVILTPVKTVSDVEAENRAQERESDAALENNRIEHYRDYKPVRTPGERLLYNIITGNGQPNYEIDGD